MASMRSPDINLIHFILRLLIAVGSFVSAIFKIPFVIFAIQFVIDFVLKGTSAGGNTDAGDSGTAPGPSPGSSDTSPSDQPASDAPKQFDLPMVEVALNVVLLVCLFTSVMVVLFRAIYTVALGRLLNVYSYLIIMGLWIVFVLITIMTNGWKGPLNYAILAARALLVGWFVFTAPATWHFVLLRSSIIIDIITYPAMIGIAILNIKYNFLKVGVDRKIGVWTRYNNLIRTL
ncbi:uncharacterized protein LOC128396356 [Panonychus citri]|uniref:uncharacterized protein LOC128396356 n=1 Tax=Panonychus citri TaxID=50023 RepID=UPI002307B432|nr:uncharacterized protein LOC128396356 [Panonychus citri]